MDTDNIIFNDLSIIFCEVFKNPSLRISIDSNSNEIDGWDSLKNIQLMISIEKKFGIRFTASEVSSLENIGDLCKLILLKTENSGLN